VRVINGLSRVIFEPQEDLDAMEMHRAGTPEQGGWISRTFGRKVPGTSVCWRSAVNGTTVLRTRITFTRLKPGVY
jgi:hypothetical protein